jgi:hypothetical protein
MAQAMRLILLHSASPRLEYVAQDYAIDSFLPKTASIDLSMDLVATVAPTPQQRLSMHEVESVMRENWPRPVS